jgi:hypothetical protein
MTPQVREGFPGGGRAAFGETRAAVCLLGVGLLLWAAPARGQYSTLPAPDKAITLQPPRPDQLFRLESEKCLQDRIRQEANQKAGGPAIQFPDGSALAEQPPATRRWPQQVENTVPGFVCYGRLYFEQVNAERYGWDFGPLHPFLSGAVFYADVALLPYHLATDPCRKCECSAGYCLPGDPVPFLLYPPDLSLTGTVAEGGTIAALLAIFP